MMSNITYSICKIRLDSRDKYIIWYSKEQVGVIIDSNNSILNFSNTQSVLEYSKENGIEYDNEKPVFYNLSWLEKWCVNPDPDKVECNRFLNNWNLFGDIALSEHRI